MNQSAPDPQFVPPTTPEQAESDTRLDTVGWRWHALAGICFVLIVICLGLDLLTPVGISDAIVYLAVVLLSIRLFSSRFTLIIAMLASAATIAGLIYSPTSDPPVSFPLTNRLLCISAIWLTAFLGLLLIRESKQRRAVQESLHTATIQLERRMAEARLRESEERFRLAVDAVEEYAIVQLDVDGRVSSWNLGAQRITGFDADDVMGKHVSMFYTPASRETGVADRTLSEAAMRGRFVGEGWRVRKDGSRFWSSVVVTSLRDEHGHLRGFLKITRDMTERKRLEKQIVDLTMQEQQRIGRELHDSFGQQVTGIALLAANLKRMLEARDAPEAERAASLMEVIEDARAEVRAITKGLLPVEVDANGLQSALQELVESTETTFGLQCDFRCSSPVAVENNTAATHLYKIAQEAIHNAVKHADANRLIVSLSETDSLVTLSVEDNGKGIEGDPQKLNGSGLHIMRYRAGLLDATLEIHNREGGGTTVSCTVQREARATSHPADMSS